MNILLLLCYSVSLKVGVSFSKKSQRDFDISKLIKTSPKFLHPIKHITTEQCKGISFVILIIRPIKFFLKFR